MKRAIEGFLIAITLAMVVLMSARAEDSGVVAEATKYFERANKFVEAGSLPRAKLEYEKAIKLYPKYLDAYYNLGVVCEKVQRLSELDIIQTGHIFIVHLFDGFQIFYSLDSFFKFFRFHPQR